MTERTGKSIALMTLTALAAALLVATSAEAGWQKPRAVTLWWVIFNNPDACSADPGGDAQCSSVDVLGAEYLDSVANGSPDPSLISPNLEADPAVLYATGAITSTAGRVRMTASIYRSPDEPLSLEGMQVVDPMGLDRGFVNPDAEVHLVVRDHGKRVRGGTVAQSTSFLDPYCSDPALLVEGGENICADVQFTVFGADEQGERAVFRSSDGSPVPRASATLIRQQDVLQAVIETKLRRRRN